MRGAAIETNDTGIGTRTAASPSVSYYDWIYHVTDLGSIKQEEENKADEQVDPPTTTGQRQEPHIR